MRISDGVNIMNFMECTTCKAVVLANNTGTCLGCQNGFVFEKQEDAWKPEYEDDDNADEQFQYAMKKESPKKNQWNFDRLSIF